jgi:hypothetical protein
MSDADAILTFPTKQAPDRSREWSDRDKETAFEVWMELGRPALSVVVNVLAAEHDLAIPHETVRRWHRDDLWDIEADRRLAEYAPNLLARSASHVVNATHNAAAYIDRVWAGSEPFAKAKMTAALQTLDRGGFSPGNHDRPALAERKPLPELPPVTNTEEALARIQLLRERSRRR